MNKLTADEIVQRGHDSMQYINTLGFVLQMLETLNDEITTRMQHLAGCLAVLHAALSHVNEDNAPQDFSYSVHSTVELAAALADGLFSPVDEIYTIAVNASSFFDEETE